MTRVVGPKPANLDIVAQQVRPATDRVVRSGEELLLVVEARAPCEVGSNLEIFTQHMTHHVYSEDSFGRLFIMRAAGRMDVMIA